MVKSVLAEVKCSIYVQQSRNSNHYVQTKVTAEIRIKYCRDEISPVLTGARGCMHGPIGSVEEGGASVQKSISNLDCSHEAHMS
jgi:hypothetical protein